MSEQLGTYTQRQQDEEEINLLDLLIVLAKNKKQIVGTALVVAMLTAGISLILPNIYVANTKILPPQQAQSSATAMLGQLGALGGLAGSSLGIKNPSDTYLGMLGSRTIGDRLISRFNLDKVYKTKLHSDTLKALSGATNFASGKDGLIGIEVEDKDPKLAAALANAYVEELQKLMLTMAVTDAAQRRAFFERQLLQAKQNLADSEVELKKVQEKTGLIRLDGQAEMIIGAAANLKAQIAAKEVELSAMRSFATANNPDFIRIEQELNGLRAQLAKAETGIPGGRGDISVSTSRVPEAGLEYVRKMRDVKYNETIFELLAKQFEIAKLDEAKDGALIQVLDKAVEPDRKSKPKRAVMVLLATVTASFLAVCWAFIKEWMVSLKKEVGSEEHARLIALRNHLGWTK